jgi:two-component system, chemotaxis family, chemotaxis protein CheY
MILDVLIVDDSAAIRKILQRVLKQTSIPIGTVHEAGDGMEALNILRSEKVNLVFADINMPNMDGLQLLGQIKNEPAWKDLPVIMVTTEGGQTKVMTAVELGAAAYVRKPFTADQIRETITASLGLG